MPPSFLHLPVTDAASRVSGDMMCLPGAATHPAAALSRRCTPTSYLTCYCYLTPCTSARLCFTLRRCCRYSEFYRAKKATEANVARGCEPPRPMSLAMSEAAYSVRCNSDQQAAVEKLQEGIFLVHGPPGTGTPPALPSAPCCAV